MKRAPARAPERIALDLPADLRYLRIVGLCVQELIGHDPSQHVLQHEIEMALHEICVNIVVHAYDGVSDGRLDVVLSKHGSELVVQISDRGKPFDQSTVKPPDLEAGQVHGYGMFMAQSLADEISYLRTHDGVNQWRVVKRWT
jgi:serine/threonine-protein kinase RsbW